MPSTNVPLISGELVVAADPELDRLRPIRFRRSFTCDDVVHATLRITACGIYRAFLDGERIGDEILAPGWTSYHHRHLVQEFDLTARLGAGDHVLGIEVAEGWWRGRLGWGDGAVDNYGTDIGPIAELELVATDGTVTSVVTDGSWRWAPSATLSASLYDGEHHDLRLDEPWPEPSFDDTGWAAVTIGDFDPAPLMIADVPPVRVIESLHPVDSWTAPSGRTIVDFGQNMSGVLRVDVPPVAGQAITFRHAEVLEDDELGMRPLRNAAATDVIVTDGRAGRTWTPSFTMHGFRYVDVDGWPGEFDPASLSVDVCHTDMAEMGAFDCSDGMLKRLHENVRWSAKGNFVSVPTDCPQRDERLGWTGDLQVFAPTASFLFDCRSMLRSWLADLAADQSDDGRVPIVVPALRNVTADIPFAGWSDAAVIVPWVLYERFGDVDVLEKQYESMVAWVDAVRDMSAPDGLWRMGQLGDWLDPSTSPDNPFAGRTDGTLVGCAYQVHVLNLMTEIARILGRGDDEAAFGERAAQVRDAFRAEYVTPNGRVMSDSPAAYSMAICFGLLDGAEVDVAGARLRELVSADRWCIGTGFLGTPLVCDALVAAGGIDDAFKLLTQTECPSWLYPVTMGATTVWERWDSMLPDGSINPGEMTSFNHYAFGAVADFLHRRVAGLAPAEPGYRVMEVRPLVGGGLTSASARHRSAHGEMSTAWTRVGERFTLTVVVPDGCEAVVGLPDGSDDRRVGPGEHEFTCSVRAAADDPVHG